MGNLSGPVDLSRGDQDGESSSFYIRGAVNMVGTIDTLLVEHGMVEATDVVLHGCSAGAQAVTVMGDVIRSVVPQHISFAVIADSGMIPISGHPFATRSHHVWYRDWQSRAKGGGFEALAMHDEELQKIGRRLLDIVDANAIHLRYTEVIRLSLQSMLRMHDYMYTFPVSQRCTSWTVQKLSVAHDEAVVLCQISLWALAFSEVPIFVLNSIYDSWSNYAHEGEAYEDCIGNARCRHVKSVLGLELEAQFDWAFDSRWGTHPGVPVGAFLDYCSHHCKKWNELTGGDNRTNAQHVGAWLALVRTWHAATPAERLAHSHRNRAIHWQRRGAPFPCEECCT